MIIKKNTNETIKTSSVKAIIARWRIKHGMDHEAYKKMFDELYKSINTHKGKLKHNENEK